MKSDRLRIQPLQFTHGSCSVCRARDYGPEEYGGFGPVVDQLYELTVGGMVMTMCKDCLLNLRDLIDSMDMAENQQ